MKNFVCIFVSLLLVGCASRGDLKDLEKDLKNTREDLKQDIYDTHQALKAFIISEDNGIESRVEREFCVSLYDDVTSCDDKPKKGCFIDGMITDSDDNDGCVSPGVVYCTTPGLVYMPNTGDGDNCQSPKSFCEGNPDEC